MLRLPVFFLLILFSSILSAKNLKYEKQCGKYRYIIVVEDAESYDTAKIKHYYQEGVEQKQLFHQSEYGMFVTASCTKDKNNVDVLVFTEECDGSGCIDSIYGLFNLKQKKLLLKPSDWSKGNEEQLAKILGGSDFLNTEDHFTRFKDLEFCCITELAAYRQT
jgi:hypothetical protein